MRTSKVLWWGFVNAVGVAVYTGIVSWMLLHLESVIGKQVTFLGPALLLLLFVVSAAVVGAFIFGRPVLLYLAGEKHGALVMFLTTVTVLVLITFFIIFFQL